MSDGDLSPEAEAEVAAILAELRPVAAANVTVGVDRDRDAGAGAVGRCRRIAPVGRAGLEGGGDVVRGAPRRPGRQRELAFHLYARVLELEPPAGTREEARLGLAAAMCADPAPESAVFDLAIGLTGQLVDEVAAGDDEELRASALIRSFTAITERLPMRNQAAPFGSHQYWAAFVYVGV